MPGWSEIIFPCNKLNQHLKTSFTQYKPPCKDTFLPMDFLERPIDLTVMFPGWSTQKTSMDARGEHANSVRTLNLLAESQ